MAKRSKIVGPVLKSREQAALAASTVADLMLKRQQKASEMEELLGEIRSEYTPQLDELDQAVELHTLSLKDWADGNAAEFGDARSIQFASARVGYRLHPPHIESPFKRLGDLVNAIGALGAALAKRFLVVKTSPNKDAMLDCFAAAREGKSEAEAKAAAELGRLGIRAEQSEQFFVEPVREQLEVEPAKV